MKKVSILPRSGTWAAADHTRALGQGANNIFITCSFQGLWLLACLYWD